MKPILGHTKPASPGEGSQSLRIGDVASLVGTTPRTIRYYEEIGLLPAARSRPSGRHRVYTEADVERLREVMRLKDLLGLSLEELRMLLAASFSARRWDTSTASWSWCATGRPSSSAWKAS